MDFTFEKYKELLQTLNENRYISVLRFKECSRLDGCEWKDEASVSRCRYVLLRHDVDLKPFNSLRTAQIEKEFGMKAIYYFRAVAESWDEEIIKHISSLGHEIGYHYECLTTCKGNIDAAYQDFCFNLQRLSELIGQPIKSICMHGSPRSSFDSRDIWKKYDYHLLGIDFEPYLDTDWSRILYLTDTGRRWDGYKVSVRDKIPNWQERWESEGLSFHTTDDVINRIPTIPYNLMITTHPQRWNEIGLAWVQELILQNAKNIVKQHIVHHQC